MTKKPSQTEQILEALRENTELKRQVCDRVKHGFTTVIESVEKLQDRPYGEPKS